MTDIRIAYIGYQAQEQYAIHTESDENLELLNFLKQKGLKIELVFWNDPEVDWKKYDVAILKSPWDYHEAIEKFYQWLDQLDRLSLKLFNPVSLVKWNSDKHYLQEIAKAGLPVISSVFLEKNSELSLDNGYFDRWNTGKLVIKPCISAGAKNTMIIDQEDFPALLPQVNRLLHSESYILQPFEAEVADGEWSFIFFNQQFSHGVLKIPKSGDFRVQHHFGGQILYPDANAKHIEQAQQYVDRFAPATLYARVDGLIKNGQFVLMELELIEPYLFLNAKQDRMEKYYEALLALMNT